MAVMLAALCLGLLCGGLLGLAHDHAAGRLGLRRWLLVMALLICAMGIGVANALAAPASAVATVVPAAALKHLPALRSEQQGHWPSHPAPWLLASLIEHESCLSLTHSRCWQPTSRLKTQREEGAGFGQLTRAFRADGSLRFDALAEQRQRHPSLSELSWANIYQRPDLQLRTIVLMMRELHTGMPPTPGRMAFADAAYNGGAGGLQADRRACKLKPGCDAGQWFGHVEHTCTKSRAALYGQRSACDINRHHVNDVLLTRSNKYRATWPNLGT